MNKKVVPIVTIVLAIGLFVFVLFVQKKEHKKTTRQDLIYEQSRPLSVRKEELEQELETLRKLYEKSISPKASVQVLFTDLNEQVYTTCYPIMKEYEDTGILTVSATQLPGEEGCMTKEQFQELVDAGWDVYVTWQTKGDAKKWWPNLQNKLTVLGVRAGKTMYFPKGTYQADADKVLLELGFTSVLISKNDEESPLQMQEEEGIWHVGAVGMMTSKPKLWLREAVAQDANVAYLVGFSLEEELYNENSFRSMLNSLEEYKATEELIVTDVEDARDGFRARNLGVDTETEKQYQEQKTALEVELADVKKQLQEMEANY